METFGAITLWKLATSRVGIIVIAAALGVAVLWAHGAKRYRDGVQGERLVWTEKVRREAAALGRERVAAQARIDQLAADRLAEATDWALERAALEAEIEREKADDAAASTRARTGCACSPALSRGLSERLDRIGR